MLADTSQIRTLVQQAVQNQSRLRAKEQGEIAALMDRFEKAFVARDVSRVASCVTEDFVWNLPHGESQSRGTSVRGREELKAVLVERFRETRHIEFSDFQYEIFGPTIVQRYRVTTCAGISPRLDAAGLDVYRVRDNLIASKDAYWKAVEWPPVQGSGAKATAPVSLSENAAAIINERVITEAVLRRIRDATQRVSIPGSALLTPAAKDYLRARSITVERRN